jgi:hypothetical protein
VSDGNLKTQLRAVDRNPDTFFATSDPAIQTYSTFMSCYLDNLQGIQPVIGRETWSQLTFFEDEYPLCSSFCLPSVFPMTRPLPSKPFVDLESCWLSVHNQKVHNTTSVAILVVITTAFTVLSILLELSLLSTKNESPLRDQQHYRSV